MSPTVRSQIYREGSSRYVAIKYRVRGRDLGGAVEQAIKTVERDVKLPVGYSLTWAGEYESAQRAQRRLAIIIPLTLLLIFFILYLMFASMKWSLLVLAKRRHGAGRRSDRALSFRCKFQRVLGRRISRSVRRLRPKPA